MSMSVISGKDGTLHVGSGEVTPVTNWRLEKTSGNKAYAANDTGGARRRVAGVRDCRGSFEVKATSTGHMPVDEGDSVTLQLHVDDSGNNYYQVPAIIDQVRVDVDISQGEIVAYVIDFSGDGLLAAYGILAKSSESSS
jgi:hypothetical protein